MIKINKYFTVSKDAEYTLIDEATIVIKKGKIKAYKDAKVEACNRVEVIAHDNVYVLAYTKEEYNVYSGKYNDDGNPVSSVIDYSKVKVTYL